jgi:hypothetical protein
MDQRKFDIGSQDSVSARGSMNNRQADWFGCSKRVWVTEPGVGILGDLFWHFEIPIKRVIVFIFALFGGVFAAYIGSRFIDATAVIRLQMFASCMYQQVPAIVFGKYGGAIMKQVPT